VDGQELISQTAKPTGSDPGWGFGNFKIYERIGCLGLLLGNPNITPIEFGSFLRCYEDGNLSYHDPDYIEECDFITSVNSTLPEYFDIYPIPVTDLVHCSNNSLFEGQIVIYNLLGSIVYSTTIFPNSTITIDLSNYDSLLLGVVRVSNSQVYAFNLVKF